MFRSPCLTLDKSNWHNDFSLLEKICMIQWISSYLGVKEVCGYQQINLWMKPSMKQKQLMRYYKWHKYSLCPVASSAWSRSAFAASSASKAWCFWCLLWTLDGSLYDSSIAICSFSCSQFSISSASRENCCNVWASPNLERLSMRASFSLDHLRNGIKNNNNHLLSLSSLLLLL